MTEHIHNEQSIIDEHHNNRTITTNLGANRTEFMTASNYSKVATSPINHETNQQADEQKTAVKQAELLKEVASYKDVILKGYQKDVNSKVRSTATIHRRAAQFDFPTDKKWIPMFDYCYEQRGSLSSLRATTAFEQKIITSILQGDLFVATTPTFLKQIWSPTKISLFDLRIKRLFGGSLYCQLLPGMHLPAGIKQPGILNNIFRDKHAPELRKKLVLEFKKQVYTATYDHDLRVITFGFQHNKLMEKWKNQTIAFQNKPLRLREYVGNRLHQRHSSSSSKNNQKSQVVVEPTTFHYSFRLGNIDTKYELWDVTFFVQHVLQLNIKEIYRTIMYNSIKEDATQWTVILQEAKCPAILEKKTCLFWDGNYVFIHHSMKFTNIPCSWCFSHKHHYNKCSKEHKSNENNPKVLCLKSKPIQLIDNNNPWGMDGLEDYNTFEQTSANINESFLLGIYHSLPWELDAAMKVQLFPNLMEHETTFLEAGTQIVKQQSLKKPQGQLLEESEQIGCTSPKVSEGTVLGSSLSKQTARSVLLPDGNLLREENTQHALPTIASSSRPDLQADVKMSALNSSTQAILVVEETIHNKKEIYKQTQQAINLEKQAIKKQLPSCIETDQTDCIFHEKSPLKDTKCTNPKDLKKKKKRKTVHISSNLDNASRFESFLIEKTIQDRNVKSLLKEIQGVEEVSAARGHCMCLSALMALKNSKFYSHHKLITEEEDDIQWLKDMILTQYKSLGKTFHHNFDGMISDFRDEVNLTTIPYAEKQEIILQYLNTIVSTPTQTALDSKFWGNTGVLELICILTQLPIYIIEINDSAPDIMVSTMEPIERQPGRQGAYIYTKSSSLTWQAFRSKKVSNSSQQGISSLTLVHRDHSHYNAVLFNNIQRTTLAWRKTIIVKTFLHTINEGEEMETEQLTPVHKGHTPQMKALEQQIDSILNDTIEVMKAPATVMSQPAQTVATTSMMPETKPRAQRKLISEEHPCQAMEVEPSFDLGIKNSNDQEQVQGEAKSDASGSYTASQSVSWTESDTPSPLTINDLGPKALAVMERLLEPIDHNRVAAYGQRHQKTFAEAKDLLHQEAINAAWDGQRTGDFQDDVSEIDSKTGSTGVSDNFGLSVSCDDESSTSSPVSRSLRSLSQQGVLHSAPLSPISKCLRSAIHSKLDSDEVRLEKKRTLLGMRKELFRILGKTINQRAHYAKVLQLPVKAPAMGFYSDLIHLHSEILFSLLTVTQTPILFLKQFSKTNLIRLSQQLIITQLKRDLRKAKLRVLDDSSKAFMKAKLKMIDKCDLNSAAFLAIVDTNLWHLLYGATDSPCFTQKGQEEIEYLRAYYTIILSYIFPSSFGILNFESEWTSVCSRSKKCAIFVAAVDGSIKHSNWTLLRHLLKTGECFLQSLEAPHRC